MEEIIQNTTDIKTLLELQEYFYKMYKITKKKAEKIDKDMYKNSKKK